jgi:hypothetical protein
LTTKDPKTEGSTQQELTEFDEKLNLHFQQIEDDVFNRKERLQQLEEGTIPETNTILTAVFQEIKKQSDKTRKKSTKKNRVHSFKIKRRLCIFISRISQAGKVKSLKNKIRPMRLFSSRVSFNSATSQRSALACPEGSITYLKASSIRFPVA